MSPVHGLQVRLWVPVGVVEDDHVSGVQVDTEATGPGGQGRQDDQEQEQHYQDQDQYDQDDSMPSHLVDNINMNFSLFSAL